MPSRRHSPGFSFLELLVVLVVVGILAGLAGPALGSTIEGIRRRAVLDAVTNDLFRARILAIRSGDAVEIRFLADPAGCVASYVVRRPSDGVELNRVRPGDDAPGVCLEVRGASTVRIDGRGLPSGAARTLTARLGARSDSLKVSMVGRVLRFY